MPRWDTNEKEIPGVDLFGGSGGYIYINTKEKYNSNDVSWGARIAAIGGFGKGLGTGGSGGVIVFGHDVKNNFASVNTRTFGGRGGNSPRPFNSTLCGNAAAGTTYWASTDVLHVSNYFVTTNKHTFLTAKLRSPDKFPNMFLAAENLVISGSGKVNILTNSIRRIVFDKF